MRGSGGRARAAGTERILAQADAHREAGRLAAAGAGYRRLLALRPGDPAASYGLGSVAGRAGDHAGAVTHFVAALRGAPEHPRHWVALATSLIASDRLPEARAVLERFRGHGFPQTQVAAYLEPVVAGLYAEAERRRGAGDPAGADAALDTLVLLDDAHVPALRLAALIAGERGESERAVDLLTIAVYRDPTDAAAFRDLGAAFRRAGNGVAAQGAFEKAVELDPAFFPARGDLADLHIAGSRVQDALPHLEAIVAGDPGRAGAHNNLAFVQMQLGRSDAALASYDRAVALAPDDLAFRSNRLLLKLYMPAVSPADYIADAREYGRRAEAGHRRTRPFANPRDPDRRLRVGFVSADLRNHVVTCFLEPFLAHLDRAAFEPVAYSAGTHADAVTERLKAAFALWRDISGLDDGAAAALAEADGIDILIDLSGHSAGNRLPVLARRPAPVQVTWIGYPGSTGLSAIDYRITDHAYEPAGTTDAAHSETLWRLPGVTVTYRPSETPPETADAPPFARNGFVTLGCLNRLAKAGPETLAAWARILRALPEARLLLVAADAHDPRARAALEAWLAQAGLPVERLILEARTGTAAYYALFNRVDLALDPFPHNGGTTSYDALTMGVPFVTLRDARTAGRLGAAILEPMGLGDMVTESVDAYVARVVELAHDRAQLARLRTGLAERMRTGPHRDHARHAAEVEAALRAMWRRRLAEDDGAPAAAADAGPQ